MTYDKKYINVQFLCYNIIHNTFAILQFCFVGGKNTEKILCINLYGDTE